MSKIKISKERDVDDLLKMCPTKTSQESIQ
jgi:hypothetical protein